MTADAKLLADMDALVAYMTDKTGKMPMPEVCDIPGTMRRGADALRRYVGVSPSADEACDRAYVNGLRAGWNFGVANDPRGFNAAMDCRDAEIRRSRISLSPTKEKS